MENQNLQNSSAELPKAVCFFIINEEGDMLAVSRPDNPEMWGMPGGKVERGETLIQAVMREVKEEVGLVVDPDMLFPVHRGVCDGDQPYDVTTFYYTAPGPNILALAPEPGLVLQYVRNSVLVNPATTPFSNYNMQTFTKFAIMWMLGIVPQP